MSEKSYSVEELAGLCHVDKITVRRWRNDGLRGTKLKSTEDGMLKGKQMRFAAADVYDFVLKNPKVSTPELEKELMTAEAVLSLREKMGNPNVAYLGKVTTGRTGTVRKIYIDAKLKSLYLQLDKLLAEIDELERERDGLI